MNREELTKADYELVALAIEESKKQVLQLNSEKLSPRVSAAIRLSNEEIIMAVNLLADVRGLSICAEATAVSKSSQEYPNEHIEVIVAVYNNSGQEPMVVSPCGSCREFITDYSVNSYIILREPNSEDLFKVRATELLPFKYAIYKENDKLI